MLCRICKALTRANMRTSVAELTRVRRLRMELAAYDVRLERADHCYRYVVACEISNGGADGVRIILGSPLDGSHSVVAHVLAALDEARRLIDAAIASDALPLAPLDP